jgi:hypothetical protein
MGSIVDQPNGLITMEEGTDKHTPFDKDCQRIDNEVITSNDPSSKSEITRMSCGAQFATGFTKVTTRGQERRFPVVDEERGLVLDYPVRSPLKKSKRSGGPTEPNTR